MGFKLVNIKWHRIHHFEHSLNWEGTLIREGPAAVIAHVPPKSEWRLTEALQRHLHLFFCPHQNCFILFWRNIKALQPFFIVTSSKIHLHGGWLMHVGGSSVTAGRLLQWKPFHQLQLVQSIHLMIPKYWEQGTDGRGRCWLNQTFVGETLTNMTSRYWAVNAAAVRWHETFL